MSVSMNQNEEETVVSRHIVPSARKGIHHHDSGTIANSTDMGRYGEKSRRDNKPTRSTPPQHFQGVDEVDNVMSKHARGTSPKLLQLEKGQVHERRNSLSTSDQQFSDDDSDSDEFGHQSLEKNDFSKTNSYSFTETLSRSQNNRSNEYNSSSEPLLRSQNNRSNHVNKSEYSYSTSFQNETRRRPGNTFSCGSIILPIMGVIGIIAAWQYGLPNTVLGTGSRNNYDKLKFIKEMNDLGEKYKISDNSILEVQSGLSTILERNDTGSFIFVYNGKSMNFDHSQFSNLMEDIASTAARYLRNNSGYNRPTVIQSSELDMESHSELMTKYRTQVAKTGVMLVKDIDRIPSSLAMAFHYFCDEYNPLVAKSAIFFTLNLAACSDFSEQKSTHYDVEKCLANKWNAVPKDNIKPLLARVVNVVIDVS